MTESKSDEIKSILAQAQKQLLMDIVFNNEKQQQVFQIMEDKIEQVLEEEIKKKRDWLKRKGWTQKD